MSGFSVTALGTLAGRILGLARDMALASVLGMGAAMDAFAVALRVPNLFRRLFGEGALAASYLPVLAAELERDPRAGWRLASVLLTWLAVVLSMILVAAEGACAVIAWLGSGIPGLPLLAGLIAAMMPYMVLVCLAAQLSATLQALSCFAVPALAPSLLNVCLLAGAWLAAPSVADPQARAYLLAACVVASGVLQLAVQVPPLVRSGFRFDCDFRAARGALAEVVRGIGPTVLGLAVTQANALVDSLMAWGLAAGPGTTIWWLGGTLCYPLEQGAASAIYFGERLYQFPLGMVGAAMATAIFPLLARHAARGQRALLAGDLLRGLRIVALLAVPASAGLVLLAQPLAGLFFGHGQVTAAGTERIARLIACYSGGVCAFCAAPVLVRAFYAVGDRRTPVRIALAACGLNVVLNFALVWPLAEVGLAVSTALCAGLQMALLARAFNRRVAPLAWHCLARTLMAATAAALAMALVCLAVRAGVPAGGPLGGSLAAAALPVALGGAVYFLTLRLIAPADWSLLRARGLS